MSDELTKPLAERITPGEFHVEKYTGAADSCRVISRDGYKICGGHSLVGRANALLIAEAFNVTHETGRTPRQLADELEAVKKLLKDVQLMVQYQAKRELIIQKIHNFRSKP